MTEMKASGNKGFALYFLIAAILVIGALIGAGLTLVGPRAKKARYDRTQDILAAAEQSIVSWAAANGRIPVWGDNVPDATIDEFCEVTANQNDAFTRPLVYIYDNNLTVSLCGRSSTALSYGAAANTAFLIISGAEDMTVNTTPAASVAVLDTSPVNVAPGTADLVRAVSLEELRNQAGCFSYTAGRLKILNNELPNGHEGNTFNNFNIYADGGVPFAAGGKYKWCIKGTLPPGTTTTPNTPACPTTTDCAALGTESATQWSQADSLTINGMPTITPQSRGDYNITILVRDNNDNNTALANDNCAQKSLVITINP